MSAYSTRAIAPTPTPLEGDASITFDMSAYPLIDGMEGGVLVTRNGVITDNASVTVTGLLSATVALASDELNTVDDIWKCRYPYATAEGLTGGTLDIDDVREWADFPVVTFTDSKLTRSLAAATAWARAYITEVGMASDTLYLWQQAVLNMCGSLLTRGQNPVLGVEVAGTSTTFGAMGGIDPSEELEQTAIKLINWVLGGSVTRSSPAMVARMEETINDQYYEIPISVRQW